MPQVRASCARFRLVSRPGSVRITQFLLLRIGVGAAPNPRGTNRRGMQASSLRCSLAGQSFVQICPRSLHLSVFIKLLARLANHPGAEPCRAPVQSVCEGPRASEQITFTELCRRVNYQSVSGRPD
ncbi:hypothetical protein C8R46DRAFT_179924 [Mycena filopes]|nr:hypothetical protein C8R46DRAFT_179924 [Mycena filopes]